MSNAKRLLDEQDLATLNEYLSEALEALDQLPDPLTHNAHAYVILPSFKVRLVRRVGEPEGRINDDNGTTLIPMNETNQ